jgi:hypothetical protein
LSEIANILKSGKSMTADTISNPGFGIVGSHEYVISDVNTSNGTLTLYNPHAQTKKGEINGVRVISYNDFQNNFEMINVA